MLKIYHNNRCSKSRAALQYLNDKDLDIEIVEYLKNPLTESEFKALLNKLHIPASDLIRTQEDIFKKEFKGLNLTEEEWIKILLKHPKLMKRPIVETQLKAIWAVPADEIETLL